MTRMKKHIIPIAMRKNIVIAKLTYFCIIIMKAIEKKRMRVGAGKGI